MKKLQQLLDQRAELDKEIDTTRRQEKSEAVAKVKSLMTEYGLTASDLVVRAATKGSSAKGGKVAAKYRDDATGNTWSGRGLQPKWLKAALATGRKLQDFTI